MIPATGDSSDRAWGSLADVVALVQAWLGGDTEGMAVLKAHCDKDMRFAIAMALLGQVADEHPGRLPRAPGLGSWLRRPRTAAAMIPKSGLPGVPGWMRDVLDEYWNDPEAYVADLDNLYLNGTNVSMINRNGTPVDRTFAPRTVPRLRTGAFD